MGRGGVLLRLAPGGGPVVLGRSREVAEEPAGGLGLRQVCVSHSVAASQDGASTEPEPQGVRGVNMGC